MGNVVQAVNMVSGDKRTILLIESKLLEDEDIPGLEKLLSEHVQLAPRDCSIFIKI